MNYPNLGHKQYKKKNKLFWDCLKKCTIYVNISLLHTKMQAAVTFKNICMQFCRTLKYSFSIMYVVFGFT